MITLTVMITIDVMLGAVLIECCFSDVYELKSEKML